MVYRLISWCVGSVALLAVQPGFLCAQQPAKPVPSSIDYETIAAYEKIGARYLRWYKNKDVSIPRSGDAGTPVFYFSGITPNEFGVSKLPQVSVPFSIYLGFGEKLIKKGLKELAGLKHLDGLGIAGEMSDTGLKEILDALPQISCLGLYGIHGNKLTEGMIKDVAGRKNINEISFSGAEFSDDFLRVLHRHGLVHRLSRAEGKDRKRPASVDEVVSLDLPGKITNAGLKQLPAMKNLTAFHASLYMKGEGLMDIPCLQNLSTLNVHGWAVLTEQDVHGIGRFKNLTGLTFGGYKVSDAKLSCLREMPNLTRLDLWYGEVTDEGLREVGRLKNLEVLKLTATKVSDAGLEHLRGCANITELDLVATEVTDAGIKHLAPFKKLHKLSLSNVTEAGLRDLAVLDNITELRLGSPVTEAGMKQLARHKNLAVLDLRSNVAAEGLKELAGLKNLQELRLNKRVGGEEVRELRRIGMLHVLSTAQAKDGARPKSEKEIVSLRLFGVTDAGLEQIADLTSLLHLDLSYSPVTDMGLRHLAGMKQLQSLDLAKTKVTNACVKELMALPNLRRLNIYSTSITRNGRAEFAKAIPQCVVR